MKQKPTVVIAVAVSLVLSLFIAAPAKAADIVYFGGDHYSAWEPAANTSWVRPDPLQMTTPGGHYLWNSADDNHYVIDLQGKYTNMAAQSKDLADFLAIPESDLKEFFHSTDLVRTCETWDSGKGTICFEHGPGGKHTAYTGHANRATGYWAHFNKYYDDTKPLKMYTLRAYYGTGVVTIDAVSRTSTIGFNLNTVYNKAKAVAMEWDKAPIRLSMSINPVKAGDKTVSGKATVGTTVKVSTNKKNYTVKTGSNGTWTVKLNPGAVGSKTITAQVSKAKYPSVKRTLKIGSLPSIKLKVNKVRKLQRSVKGTAVKGTKVTVTYLKRKYSTTVNSKGRWKVKTPRLKRQQKLTVVATKANYTTGKKTIRVT